MTEERHSTRDATGQAVGTDEVGRIKNEGAAFRAAEAASVDSVRTRAEGPNLPRILENLDRSDNISAI